jgi:hypothetical protein
MSFRLSALVSVAGVLGLSPLAPVSAQPQVPFRPQTSPFGGSFYGGGGVFGTGNGVFGGQGPFGNGIGNGFNNGFGNPFVGGFNNGFGNPFGGGFNNGFGPVVPGFAAPGSLAFPLNQPTAFVGPQGVTTGVVGRFNNLGHWYGVGSLSGGGGHWYPNGFGNGRGVLGLGASGGAGGLYGSGLGATSGGLGTANTLLGGALPAAAAANQLRR